MTNELAPTFRNPIQDALYGTDITRDKAGRWLPGHSPNPGGTTSTPPPSPTHYLRLFMSADRARLWRKAEKLEQLAESSDPNVALKAIGEIFDRLDGKPGTIIVNTGPQYVQVLSVQPVDSQVSLPDGRTVALPDWDMVDSQAPAINAPTDAPHTSTDVLQPDTQPVAQDITNGQAPAREDEDA